MDCNVDDDAHVDTDIDFNIMYKADSDVDDAADDDTV